MKASDLFPWARIVRFDDVPYGSWQAGTTGANSLNDMRARHNYYRADTGFPFFICQDIDPSWGDIHSLTNPNFHMVDHARDLLSLGTVDLLLMPNEPNDAVGKYVPPDIYAGWVYDIKRYAAPMVPNVLIGGPQLLTWNLDPASDARIWFDEFDKAGGLDMLDVVCIHPYCPDNVNPAIQIPAWINDPHNGILSKIRGKPLMFTEMGTRTLTSDLRKGDHTPAHMAQCDLDFVTGCAGYPMIIYDGAYSLNGDGYVINNNSGVTVDLPAGNHPTQTLFPPGSATDGMVLGMQLAFALQSAGGLIAIRTVQSIPDDKTVVLTATVDARQFDVVTAQDHNACLSFWAGGWATDADGLAGMGQTPLGVALAALMPPRVP